MQEKNSAQNTDNVLENAVSETPIAPVVLTDSDTSDTDLTAAQALANALNTPLPARTYSAFLNFLMDSTSSPTLTLCSLPYDEEEAKAEPKALLVRGYEPSSADSTDSKDGENSAYTNAIYVKSFTVSGKQPFGAYPRLFLTAIINNVYQTLGSVVTSAEIEGAMASMTDLGSEEDKRRQIEGLMSLATSIITQNLEPDTSGEGAGADSEIPEQRYRLDVHSATFFNNAGFTTALDGNGNEIETRGQLQVSQDVLRAITYNPVPPDLYEMYQLRESVFLMDLYVLLTYMRNYKQGNTECREEMPQDDFRRIFFDHPSVRKEDFEAQLRDGLKFLEEKNPTLKNVFKLTEKGGVVYIIF
jgi:hypothetical protein